MKKSTLECLLLEAGNVSQHQTDYRKMMDTYCGHDLVTVAVLTVIALGAAVVPMCKSETPLHFSIDLINSEKSPLRQSTRLSISLRNPSRWPSCQAYQRLR